MYLVYGPTVQAASCFAGSVRGPFNLALHMLQSSGLVFIWV